MSLLYILLLIQFFYNVTSLHLNHSQMKLINFLIQKQDIEKNDREKVQLILYKSYEKWAVKKALEFKDLHKYKCMNIKKEEIIFSSKMGLFKSIQKYNGKYNFINYSTIYINSELLKLLTDKYSLSSVPKSYRTKSLSQKQNQLVVSNRHLLDVTLACRYEGWQLDSIFVSDQDVVSKIHNKYEKIDKIDSFMNSQTDFIKRILYLKYYYRKDNGQSLSNKHISILMGCSEETIRENLIKVI